MGTRKCKDDTKSDEAKYDRILIFGLEEIASYAKVSKQTVRNWIRLHAFPAGRLPDGRWTISTGSFDDWLRVRNPWRRRLE